MLLRWHELTDAQKREMVTRAEVTGILAVAEQAASAIRRGDHEVAIATAGEFRRLVRRATKKPLDRSGRAENL